jgi:hypothetical protein
MARVGLSRVMFIVSSSVVTRMQTMESFFSLAQQTRLDTRSALPDISTRPVPSHNYQDPRLIRFGPFQHIYINETGPPAEVTCKDLNSN